MTADVAIGRGPVLRILGPVEVSGRTGDPVCLGGGKPAVVLAALTLNANEWVSTGRLLELAWPDREPPASATNNLKTYVWQLRRALAEPLGPDRIESRPGWYRLRLRAGELDADVVTAETTLAAELLGAGRAADVASRVPGALALWRGRPYDEIADRCAHSAIARLTEQRFTLRECLAEAYVLLGRTCDAVDLLTGITAEDPSRELAWVRLINALHKAGRVRDALAAYQEARRGLILELGVEPGPELAAAHQAVLAGATQVQVQVQVLPRQLPRPVTVVGRAAEIRTLVAAGRPRVPDRTGVPDQTGVPDPARHPDRPGGPWVADAQEGPAAPELLEMPELPGMPEVPVLTVSGVAGIGKTAVALAAAHALAGHFPDGQLFVDLGTHTRPIGTSEALGRLIRSVAGPGAWLPDSLDERAGWWRSVTHGRRLMLLLDGVRDAEELRPLLPASPGCLVLATSRNRIVGLDSTDVVLGALSREDAGRLLRRRAGRLDPDVVAEVLRYCAGHPATITTLAGQLDSRPGWTLAALRDRLTAYAAEPEPDRVPDRLPDPAPGLVPVPNERSWVA